MPSNSVVIPWQRVAFASGLVAVASLATLVVVTAVGESDVLSTVALALAILAFAAQLAIAIVQSQAAIEQRGRLEELNGDTRALLADIRATTGGVLTTVQSQFETVLRHALGEAIPEAVDESVEGEGGKFDPDEFERRVIFKVAEALEKDSRFYPQLSETELGRRLLASRWKVPPIDNRLGSDEWVVHKRFGVGQVIEVDAEGKDGEPSALIRFPDGEKRVSLISAHLRRSPPPAADQARLWKDLRSQDPPNAGT